MIAIYQVGSPRSSVDSDHILYIVYTISCTFLMILHNTATDGRVHCPERRVRSLHCECTFDNKLRTSDDC